MSLSPGERETVISCTDEDDTVRIWSAQRRYITRMRNNPAFIQTGTGFTEGTEWASFTIPVDQWNPASGVKRRVNLTEQQRDEAAARLKASRGAA